MPGLRGPLPRLLPPGPPPGRPPGPPPGPPPGLPPGPPPRGPPPRLPPPAPPGKAFYFQSEHLSGWGKGRSTVAIMQTQFILVALLINYCIIFYSTNCEPTFAQPVYFICSGTYFHISIT